MKRGLVILSILAIAIIAFRSIGVGASDFRDRRFYFWRGERPSEMPVPLHVYGNVYLLADAAYLIATSEGHMIIDTITTDEDGKMILYNMRKLGFDPTKVKYIINTHYHWDHTGGNEEIIRQTGAKVLCGDGDAPFLERGNDNSTYPEKWRFEQYKQGPVPVARRLRDGDTVAVGNTTLSGCA